MKSESRTGPLGRGDGRGRAPEGPRDGGESEVETGPSIPLTRDTPTPPVAHRDAAVVVGLRRWGRRPSGRPGVCP